MQIGSGKQRYLVKQIDSRPDYDHIAYRAARGAAHTDITVIKRGLSQPNAAELAAAPHAQRNTIRGTIYFYTDDLK
jgi:hypothetical protein